VMWSCPNSLRQSMVVLRKRSRTSLWRPLTCRLPQFPRRSLAAAERQHEVTPRKNACQCERGQDLVVYLEVGLLIVQSNDRRHRPRPVQTLAIWPWLLSISRTRKHGVGRRTAARAVCQTLTCIVNATKPFTSRGIYVASVNSCIT
jgi:hypothetical protein